MLQIKPTDSELEILNVLWSNGPSSVREVHKVLSEKRDIFYTTTLKTMQNMNDKSLLNRDTSQRSHIYKPAVERHEIQQSLLKKLVNSAFSGSSSQLALSALGNAKPSSDELEEIKAIIKKLEENVD